MTLFSYEIRVSIFDRSKLSSWIVFVSFARSAMARNNSRKKFCASARRAATHRGDDAAAAAAVAGDAGDADDDDGDGDGSERRT